MTKQALSFISRCSSRQRCVVSVHWQRYLEALIQCAKCCQTEESRRRRRGRRLQGNGVRERDTASATPQSYFSSGINFTFSFYIIQFLADRTNGRAILRPSVCLSLCDVCIVAKRCVLEQKLLLTAYRKSYMRKRFVPKWMTLTFA